MAKDLGKAFLENIWGKRSSGIPVSRIDWNRPASHQDVQYLINLYPFLQIVNTNPSFSSEMEVQFVTSNSGWIIHDYGDAMSASPGEGMYGNYSQEELIEAEGGEGGEGGGVGTIVNQGYLTAVDMMILAIEKGWPGAEIIAGTSLMKWAAWMAAQDNNFTLAGYEPTKEDKEKRARIKKSRPEAGPAPEEIIRPR